MKSKAIKLHYHPGETGYATQIGEQLAIIDNVPFDRGPGDPNYMDIVQFDPATGDVKTIIHNRYPAHAIIRYPKETDFPLLVRVFVAAGCAPEGGAGPEGDLPGFMVVAAPKGVDPKMIAQGLGIDQHEEKT